jgi:hypothetical protein
LHALSCNRFFIREDNNKPTKTIRQKQDALLVDEI